MIQKIWRRGCLLSWQIGSYVYLTLASILKYEPKRKEDAGKSKDKIIYLTFDDGPGPYTRRLLKILDRYHVKATFFVTGKGERDIIKEFAASQGKSLNRFVLDAVEAEMKRIKETE